MSYDEVLAAARGLTGEQKWQLIQTLHAYADDGTGREPGTGVFLFPPSPRNGWRWEPSADLLAQMERLLEQPRREAS